MTHSNALASQFGKPEDVVYDRNDHMNYYEDWVYLGSVVSDKGYKVDLYYVQCDQGRNNKHSIVHGNDPWEYSSFGKLRALKRLNDAYPNTVHKTLIERAEAIDKEYAKGTYKPLERYIC